ncbi:MAG: hypothetical protein MI802_11945 [Desulfobacterales bacterium]|nr:hypothetical protein [Desulfobacterales bacterium]
MKHPMRLAIAACFLNGDVKPLEKVVEELKPTYETDRTFSREKIEDNIIALKAVGILKPAQEFDNSQAYVISNYGRDRVKKAL